ncbi:MAG TPA: hypothetical protein VME63_16355 [Dyella sp.]|uniref:hypothetical protein n=1 Tax=Dyella sp. TaxID=1869338 RepID=UPI002C237068|nr:hypothetical protein [Dyella sp.]HTV86973.1 hypothetical protein [Dyella sp.]
MKKFSFKMTLLFCISVILTGCGSSGPSDSDVLKAYKEWVVYRQNNGESALPLPPEAIVDHCEKDNDPPVSNAVFFICYVRFGGAKDTNLNPITLQRGPDGQWSRSD